MSCPSRYAIILALMLACVGTFATANSQTKTPRKPLNASVSGRVTIHGKGKGGVVVGLRPQQFGPQSGPIFRATSDPEGNYRITDVPAGNYLIGPIAPAFVSPDLAFFGPRGKPLLLAEGEIVDGIDFSIIRGAVITGKVTHADGRPMIEEQIRIMMAEQGDQRAPDFTSGMAFQTDDRGVYRIFGLPPGRYRVSVGQDENGYYGRGNRLSPAYERVFYPDVTDLNEAKIIELGEGDEANNIDITVGQKIPGFAATGLIVDAETSHPLPNIRVGVQKIRGDRAGTIIEAGGTSNSRGEFRLENITPGRYELLMLPLPNTDLQSDAVPFEVVDQDVTGLRLKTSKGATLSGIVVIEGASDKKIIAKLAQLRVHTYVSSEGRDGDFVQTSVINGDGSFMLRGLKGGVANLSIGAQGRGSKTGFVIARVERDGVVQPGGVEFRSGEQVSGLRVVLNYGSGTVRGSVKFENGPPPTGAQFAVMVTKPGGSGYRFGQQVDSRGHFVVEGIPGGLYDVFVNSFVPGTHGQLASARQSINVAEGATTEVELVLDLKPSPNQLPNP